MIAQAIISRRNEEIRDVQLFMRSKLYWPTTSRLAGLRVPLRKI